MELSVGVTFYTVSNDYLTHLRNYDSRIPLNNYSSNSKFFYFRTPKINEYTYLIPVSSFNVQQITNFLIKSPAGQVLSSLRFCFMFPIPDNDETIAIRLSLSGKPNNYINLVDMEEKYCSIHASEIQSRSLDVYNKVIAGVPMYRKVCCDFRKLEVACDDWVKTHDVVSLNK